MLLIFLPAALLKAEQFGLFDTPTLIAPHVRKDGTVVNAHMRVVKKRAAQPIKARVVARHPHTLDLFAGHDQPIIVGQTGDLFAQQEPAKREPVAEQARVIGNIKDGRDGSFYVTSPSGYVLHVNQMMVRPSSREQAEQDLAKYQESMQAIEATGIKPGDKVTTEFFGKPAVVTASHWMDIRGGKTLMMVGRGGGISSFVDLDKLKPGVHVHGREGWESNLIRAREYADALEIGRKGKTLETLVAEIREKIGQPAPDHIPDATKMVAPAADVKCSAAARRQKPGSARRAWPLPMRLCRKASASRYARRPTLTAGKPCRALPTAAARR